MKKVIASKKWLITYLIILFVLFSIIIAGVVYMIYSIKSHSSSWAYSILVFVYMLPVTGIILFFLNRRACLVWIEGDCIKRKGLFFGFKESIKTDEITDVCVTYNFKEIIIFQAVHSHCTKQIELQYSESHINMIKSFWKGYIREPN